MTAWDAATDACRAAGGIVRTRDLRAAGLTKRQIEAARAEGSLMRVSRGMYALPTTAREIVVAIAHGGVPACLSAAELHGLWTVEHEEHHVWLGAHGHRPCAPTCPCVAHWDDGFVAAGVLPSVPRTLVQIAVCVGAEAFFAALESALRKNLLPEGGRDWMRPRLPRSMRELLDFARTDADSGLESILRLRLRPYGLSVKFQVWRGSRRSDFLIGDRLLLEVDGKGNHEDAARRHVDLVRDAEAALWDFETLRFDYALVMHEWELVEAAILTKVEAGAHLRSRGRRDDRIEKRLEW